MTASKTNRRRFDVRVYFEDGSTATACNVVDDGTIWSRENAKANAQRTCRDLCKSRGPILAVAIERAFQLPSSRPTRIDSRKMVI